MVEENIDAIIHECETYMSTDEGKNSILNPAGRVSIAKINWNKTNFEARIKSRVDLYVINYLQSDSVAKRYENIVNEIQKFHKKAKSSIKKMDDKPIGINPLDDECTASWINLRDIVKYSSPFLVTGLACASIPLAIFSGGALAVSFFLTSISKTTKDIDDEYEKCKITVPTVIRTDLQERFAVPIKGMINSVISDLFKIIEETEKDNETVWKEREKIVARRDLLRTLDKKIRVQEETVTSLHRKLDLSKVKK